MLLFSLLHGREAISEGCSRGCCCRVQDGNLPVGERRQIRLSDSKPDSSTSFQPLFSAPNPAVGCSPLGWGPRRCRDGEAVPGRGKGGLDPERPSSPSPRAEKQRPGKPAVPCGAWGGSRAHPVPGCKNESAGKNHWESHAGTGAHCAELSPLPKAESELAKELEGRVQGAFSQRTMSLRAALPQRYPGSTRHFFCGIPGLAFTPGRGRASPGGAAGSTAGCPQPGGARRRVWLPVLLIGSRSSGETNPARRTRGLFLFFFLNF